MTPSGSQQPYRAGGGAGEGKAGAKTVTVASANVAQQGLHARLLEEVVVGPGAGAAGEGGLTAQIIEITDQLPVCPCP